LILDSDNNHKIKKSFADHTLRNLVFVSVVSNVLRSGINI